MTAGSPLVGEDYRLRLTMGKDKRVGIGKREKEMVMSMRIDDNSL